MEKCNHKEYRYDCVSCIIGDDNANIEENDEGFYVSYEDGSFGYLYKPKSGRGYYWAERYYTDHATQTGMYDHY